MHVSRSNGSPTSPSAPRRQAAGARPPEASGGTDGPTTDSFERSSVGSVLREGGPLPHGLRAAPTAQRPSWARADAPRAISSPGAHAAEAMAAHLLQALHAFEANPVMRADLQKPFVQALVQGKRFSAAAIEEAYDRVATAFRTKHQSISFSILVDVFKQQYIDEALKAVRDGGLSVEGE